MSVDKSLITAQSPEIAVDNHRLLAALSKDWLTEKAGASYCGVSER